MKREIMKTLLMLVICICSFNSSFAQVFTLTYEDNTSATKNDVIIGFVKGATDGLDPVLGEKELPPMHPIFGAHMVTILDLDKNWSFNSAVDMFTYRDLRNTEPLKVADTFWIQVSPWTAAKNFMKFSWQYPLGTGIDSVVFSDLGLVSMRVKCDEKKSYTILPNEFGVGSITNENFFVIMYRSQTANSIEDENNVLTENTLYDVVNLHGMTLLSQQRLENARAFVRTLPAGLYILHSLQSTQSILQY